MKRHQNTHVPDAASVEDIFKIDDLMNNIMVNWKLSVKNVVHFHSINYYWRERYLSISSQEGKHTLYIGDIFRQIEENALNSKERLIDLSQGYERASILMKFKECHYDSIRSLESLKYLVASCTLIEKFCAKLAKEETSNPLASFMGPKAAVELVKRLAINCPRTHEFETRLLVLKSTFLESFLGHHGYEVMVATNKFFFLNTWGNEPGDIHTPYVPFSLKFYFATLKELKQRFETYFLPIGTLEYGVDEILTNFLVDLSPDIDNGGERMVLFFNPK